ncbi:MAG: alpha/beta fold hydrolase [Deltaproteobacteria bacterium]|nr:alpha/beta fold hydrolase [Deltaproteobacteria bacterium]
MTLEPIRFANNRGQRLAGVLHGAPNGRAVVTCHGMLSDKESHKHRMLCDILAKSGLACMRFDFAGRGESDGRLFDLSYSHQVEDLQAAISMLASRGVERFGLFGSSMGGAVALLAAARDERIVAVATLAAVGHPAAIAERHPREADAWQRIGHIDTEAGHIGRGLLDDALQHDVLAAVGVLRAPVLVLHGEGDDVVPVSDGHDIAASARQACLEIVPGADHRFSNPVHLRPAMQRVAAFLRENLP